MPLPAGVNRTRAVPWTPKDGWSTSSAQLETYEKCPRRYLYTHVLGLSGGKKPTAFSRTHDCLHRLIEWLANAREQRTPSFAETTARFEEIWVAQGPADHAFSADYRRIADSLVRSLFASGADRRFRPAPPLALSLSNGRIVVEPDELATLPDGKVVLRRIRTGKKRSDEYGRHLEYALYLLVGREHFGQTAQVEAVHLTDGPAVDSVAMSASMIATRKVKSEQFLTDIEAGRFPANADAVVCPRCPHFFYCPALPAGSITLE